MAAPRAARSAAKASAEAKVTYRRAGHGWNKHADAFIDSGLKRASQNGVQSVLTRYGGLEMRFDFTPMAVQLAMVKQVATGALGSDDDVEMQESQPETAGAPAIHDEGAAAAPAATPAVSVAPAVPAEMSELSERLASLERKAGKLREKKRTQRQNKRVKAAAEKQAAVAQAAAPPAAPAFTFVTPALNLTPAVASAAAGSSTSTPVSPQASKGTAPKVPFTFGAAASSSMPPGLAPAASGARPGTTAAPQAFIPAFGGHMPYAEACLRLCGAITHASLSKARLHCVPRPAEFPDGKAPRRELMLRGGSLACGMTPKELGAKLTSMIDGGLTNESLHAALMSELFALPPMDWEATPPPGSFI